MCGQYSAVKFPPHPHPFRKLLFCMFSLFNFSSIFPGGSADPICPYVRTHIALWCAGYANIIRQLFPPFATSSFTPNFTGYDLENIDWYEAHEAMAQSPNDALFIVILPPLNCCRADSVYQLSTRQS